MKGALEKMYSWYLRRQCRYIPCHIAVIQDGNRRFAKNTGICTEAGHRLGADRTEEMLDWAKELGIRYITIYSFSTENFNRSPEEVNALFSLFREKFLGFLTDKRVRDYRIHVQMVGDRSLLPPDLLSAVDAAEQATAQYDGFFLNIAIGYGGRNEILAVSREILREVRDGRLDPGVISVETVQDRINDRKNLPPVDLIIRTANEYRTSNFLPWLANGHESAVYFCAPFWPLFRKIDLLRGIRVYSQRIETAGSQPGAGL